MRGKGRGQHTRHPPISLPCVREKMVRISSRLFQEVRLSRNPDRKWEAPLQGRGGPQHTPSILWLLSLPSPRSSLASGHCLLEDEETSEVGGPDAGELDVRVEFEDGVHAEATGPALGKVLPPEERGKWEQMSASLLTSPPGQSRPCPHVPAVTGKPPAVLPAPDDDVP